MTRIQIILGFIILSAFVGCSSGQSPVTPATSPDQISGNSENKSNRTIWGYWIIKIDPDSETIEIVPDREADLHLNVVRLLEIAPCTDCLGIGNLSWLPDNILQCDFQLKHPFADAVKLTGFDVRGVLVADGDTLFPANNRLVSLDGSNPTLINPDGYTALFNPVEFPSDSAPIPILGYFPGKFSNGDDFTGTLNPFMAYCKDNPRRMFESGAIEMVTITLKYPSVPFEFGYVVDASWIEVDEIVDPETDFPPEANCLEPYSLDFQMLTKLTNKPGDTADVQVRVYDHQGLDTIDTVSIECPALFEDEVYLDYAYPSGDDAWLYNGTITNQNNLNIGTYPSLIKVVSTESDPNLGELAAYRIVDIIVVSNGNLMWAKRAGGTLRDSGYGVTTLSDDSTVVTGYFEGSATFGPGETCESVLVSAGLADIFVVRYNPDGTLAWAKRAGGTEQDDGTGIITLPDDSTIVIGSFRDSATFGKGESAETALVSDGNSDIFLAKYNTDGTIAWAKRAGGIYEDWASGITVLSNDSTIVTGFFYDSATFGAGESAETALDSDGGRDIFLAKYNTDGTIAWAKRAGGAGDDRGQGITTLSNDSTVVTGFFEGSATFGKGEASETVLISDGAQDIFVVRYNPDGTIAWGKRAGGLDNDRGFGITSLSNDSTVVTGYFTGSATFGKGESSETVLISYGGSDIFVVHYNPDGTIAWGKRAGGTSEDRGSEIITLPDDSTVVTGEFHVLATFGEGEVNETVMVSEGDRDIFVARHNTDGTISWAKRAGGNDWDHGSGITLLSDDSTVVTGHFSDLATFGEGESTETVLESDGYNDIFVARFEP